MLECWMCGRTDIELRQMHEGWGPAAPEWTCEEDMPSTDNGPGFDDLPLQPKSERAQNDRRPRPTARVC